MGKVIIALVSVLVLVGLAIGGVFLYQNLDLGEQAAMADAGDEDNGTEDGAEGKGPLSTMKKASSPSDIPGLLTTAMKKSLDAVGWLDVPGTEISQVVMQGEDNTYYERRNEDGESNIYGCYFLDMECSMGKATDFMPNTVIYGHSDLKDNPDGPRFSQLFRFVDDDFAKENRHMYVSTLEDRFAFEIFSVFYTDVSFDYIRVHMTPTQTLALAKEAQAKSIRDYGVTLQPNDRLLTLSTCSVRDGNDGKHRFVVMGRLAEAVPEAPAQPSQAETPQDESEQQQTPAESEAQGTGDAAKDPATPQTPAPTAPTSVPDIQIPQFDFQQPEIATPQIPDIPQIQPTIPNIP